MYFKIIKLIIFLFMKVIFTYKGFIGSVNFNTDDHILFGKIEGINDLITYEGTTIEELENSFKLMIDQQIQDNDYEINSN